MASATLAADTFSLAGFWIALLYLQILLVISISSLLQCSATLSDIYLITIRKAQSAGLRYKRRQSLI